MQCLTQAIVISSLDYCNVLYIGINSSLLEQIQRIQNKACRTIFGLSKKEHVDPYLKKLHWLKIRERVEFKALLLTFKALNGSAPSYLSDLLKYDTSCSIRYPSLYNPSCNSSLGNRAFSSYAPMLWNRLPADIKQCDSLLLFKSKTPLVYKGSLISPYQPPSFECLKRQKNNYVILFLV